MTATGQQTFEKLLNFRDVGIHINHLTSQSLIKPNQIYRSGLPDETSSSDQQHLKDAYHIKTILDLRTDSEHLAQAKHNSKRQISSAPATEPHDPSKPLRIPGIAHKYISLNGHAYSGALIKQLSYWNTAKLYGLYISGYRNHAISILGKNVMSKRGLVGLAEDSLTHSTAEVKQIFDLYSDENNYPILVHCTQGKDRTGLTILLLLLLLEIPIDAIEKDYVLSEKELEPEREHRLPQIRAVGLPDDFAGCAENWVQQISTWINDQHGGIRPYLENKCGVSIEQQNCVKSILSARSSGT